MFIRLLPSCSCISHVVLNCLYCPLFVFVTFFLCMLFCHSRCMVLSLRSVTGEIWCGVNPNGDKARLPQVPLHQGQPQQPYYPPPGGFTFPPPQPPPAAQSQQVIVQQDLSLALAINQMVDFHQQHCQTSQNQAKTLETITSVTGFTNTFGSIPIYDGKDKSACAEWLQHVKEGSFQTGFNFRSALIQRATHDMIEVIRSLDNNMTHNQIIEEVMCCFSGNPSTAAAIDDVSCMRQQPGENL